VRRWQLARSVPSYTLADEAEHFTEDRTEFAGQVAPQIPPGDVINLHWVRHLIDFQAFFGAVERPVVWTLHDMNAFTGGCHYDAECGRYAAACGACPQLRSPDERDLSRQVWERKQAAFSQVPPDRLHVVAPSRWLADCARRSSLLARFPVHVIPYSLDLNTFRPYDAAGLRAALGVAPTDRVVLFVSQMVRNRRKGFALLREALAGMEARDDVVLVSVGRRAPDLAGPLRHVHLGSIGVDGLLALVYAAADVFVIPSLQDNLPNTVLEAMACGTPVVGFDAGGIPDMVRPGETGSVVPTGDVRALREALVHVLDDDDARAHMAARCRATAEAEYAPAVQARRYLDLYETVAALRRTGATAPA
jgi:glycosyltransferase involved in cell wall biosynthesis